MSSLGEMAGGVAHELNTPLNTVLARGQLIELIATSPASVSHKTLQAHSQVIIHTVERMAQIIRGLKTFARDSSADPFVRCSIQQIVDDTLSMCAERFRSHGVVIKLDVDPHISADCRASQISQVLLNLLNNAFDAVLDKSRERSIDKSEKWIEVTVAKTTTGVQLAVSNGGSGIRSEIREKIMQPFFTTKEVGKGTGLGLSISRGIAEAHSGWLIIDPLSPVAKFILWIPIEQKKPSVREAA
jgi:signal transduction histidine kinase